MIMTSLVYPVVVGWCWGGGWLGDANEKGKGFHDFAGSGIVHMVGGTAGFIGALVIGPRYGKEKRPLMRKNVLEDQESKDWILKQRSPVEVEWWVNELQNDLSFETNSFPFIVYGTIMLIVSWLFFNGGSVGDMFSQEKGNVAKIMMCTLLSSTTAGITSAFVKPLIIGTYSHNHRYDVGALTNGMLAGAVAVTAVVDRCQPWSAFFIGLISSLFYSLSCKLWKRLNIDDPIEASQVHGACGLWGLIAVGIFDDKKGLISDSDESYHYLGWQILGACSIFIWVTVITLPYFLLMRKLNLLRVPLIHEIIGLDIAEMGSQAKVDNLVAQAIYRAHQRNMRAQSYRNLYRKPGDPKLEASKLPNVSPVPGAVVNDDSQQSDVDINRINMEIDSQSSQHGPESLQIVEET